MTHITPEQYWAYKAFIRDDASEEALRSSEVFMAYRQAEFRKEAELKKINENISEQQKNDALKGFDEFEKKVRAFPELKEKLKQAKAALDASPELAQKVDPNFITGLNMLNLDD